MTFDLLVHSPVQVLVLLIREFQENVQRSETMETMDNQVTFDPLEGSDQIGPVESQNPEFCW